MCGVHHNGHSFKSHNPTSIVLLIIFTIIIKRKQNNSLSPFPRSPYRGPSPPVTIVFPANIFYIVPIIASSKSTASLRNFYCDSTQKNEQKNPQPFPSSLASSSPTISLCLSITAVYIVLQIIITISRPQSQHRYTHNHFNFF